MITYYPEPSWNDEFSQETVEVPKENLDVDKLANFIRSVDGNNTMGAGQLAEKIVEFITSGM